MFVARQFTIRTLMLVTAYTAILIVVAKDHYRGTECAIVGVWLVPVALAAIMRRRSTLAITCMALNLGLYALARTCVFATWQHPGNDAFFNVAEALFLGAFYPATVVFNRGNCPVWSESIAFIVLAASVLYALVGLGFSYCFSPREQRAGTGDEPGADGTG